MNKDKILSFLIEARKNTYARNTGKVKPVFSGSTQYEFRQGNLLYRDFYNIGNAKFMGLETIYSEDKPVWSMCYYGNFENMSEEEVDKILRAALIKHDNKARLWYEIKWKKDDYKYSCTPDFQNGIEEIAGLEEIHKQGKKIYFLFYAGGYIG